MSFAGYNHNVYLFKKCILTRDLANIVNVLDPNFSDTIHGPAQEILVHIASASYQDSYSLVKDFTARAHNVWL